MQLSIIIINYNVRYFLEQCLYSVLAAIKEIEAEVIVVDNHSTDGSMEYLHPLFPGVQFLVNEKNLGFASANNQALRQCSGEYVLFLNPDTILPEDCLQKCLTFITAHPQAAAIGVRMLDGRGRFLPESKRAFPSPLVSFYKLTGLSALFPKSKIFNRYALGHLDKNQDHSVDVLAGACMLVRKKVLEQLHGFDESYFLYGEDIDLSFRIRKTGFENLYFSGTEIIHFKGESSEDRELLRVKFFYRAMMVFVKKHYQGGAGKIISAILQIAIGCRAVVSAAGKIVKPVLSPLTDALLVWLSLQTMRMIWIHIIRNNKDFGVAFIPYALPVFSIIFILSAAFAGLYDKRKSVSKTFMSVAFATLMMLAMYSLLPESIRFSRGVILYGGMLGGVLILLKQQLFSAREPDTDAQTVIVGDEKEYAEALQLLERSVLDQNLLGRVATKERENSSLCGLNELAGLQKQFPVSRIIFCVGTLSLTEIILQMQQLNGRTTYFLFHMMGSKSIVGSHTLAPIATIVTGFADYRITYPYQKRMKRIVDIGLSLFFLLTLPFHWFLHPRSGAFARNILHVLSGNRTWVGYANAEASLPSIQKGIISATGKTEGFGYGLLNKADKLYAKNYDWWADIVIVFRNYRQLGGTAAM